MGQTKDKIKNATLEEIEKRDGKVNIKIIECDSLKQVVDEAYRNASTGDIVFFSPASASFDMFKNFMERGNLYKELVMGLDADYNNDNVTI